jgi:hypothetical protein
MSERDQDELKLTQASEYEKHRNASRVEIVLKTLQHSLLPSLDENRGDSCKGCKLDFETLAKQLFSR